MPRISLESAGKLIVLFFTNNAKCEDALSFLLSNGFTTVDVDWNTYSRKISVFVRGEDHIVWAKEFEKSQLVQRALPIPDMV